MSLVLSLLSLSRMQHLSLMHREQEFLPKVFMQLIIYLAKGFLLASVRGLEQA